MPHSLLKDSELCSLSESTRKTGSRDSYPSSRDVSLALPKSKQNFGAAAQGATCPLAARAAGLPKPHSTPPKRHQTKTATYSGADAQLLIGGIHHRLHPH